MTALRGVIALCLVASTYAASSCPQEIQKFLGVNAAKVTLIQETNGCTTGDNPVLRWEYEFTDSDGYVWKGEHTFPCWCKNGTATKIKPGMKEQRLSRQGGPEILRTECTSDADCSGSAFECAPWETDAAKRQPTTCLINVNLVDGTVDSNGMCRGAQLGDSGAVRDESGCVKEGGDLSAVTSTWDPGMAKACFPKAIIQCKDVNTEEDQGECSKNNQIQLPSGTTAVEVKSLCTAPPPEPHICKLDADFKASQIGVTATYEGEDYDLPCGPGEPLGLFDTLTLNGLMRKATGKNSWSDLTCADVTKNVTSHWNREELHHLYAKSTLQEILQSYGAACCGSLAKTIDPCPTPTPTATATATAPADTKFFVKMTVTMPYTKVEFNADAQDKYKAAVASAAGTTTANVDIVSITEERRRAGSIKVETKIRASDSAGADKLASALGEGDAVKNKINTALVAQGLKESTGVSDPVKTTAELSNGVANRSPSWQWALSIFIAAYMGVLI